MEFPLISIVACTYNGEKFLREQIESLLKQTYPNLEIIISDDGSTDKTREILSEYKDCPKLKLIFREKNLGFIKNFEATSLLAKGDYISFCDQDDIWLPNKIESLFSSIGHHSMIFSNSELIDENGNSLNKTLTDFRYMQDEHDSRCFAFMNVVPGHTMMIRKEVLKHSIPFPETQYHDWWMAVQATNLHGITYKNEVLTLYRQHSGTTTKTIIEKKNIGSRTFSKRYLDFLRQSEKLADFVNNPIEKNKVFFKRLYHLYLLKKEGKYVWPLFWFLLKHSKTLFKFAKKSFTSKLILIRKMARGEKDN